MNSDSQEIEITKNGTVQMIPNITETPFRKMKGDLDKANVGKTVHPIHRALA